MLPTNIIIKIGGITRPPVPGVDQTILTVIMTANNEMSRIETLKEYFTYKTDIFK